MLCVENCIHCRVLSDNCAPQWDGTLGRTCQQFGEHGLHSCATSASHIHCRLGAAPLLGSDLQVSPSPSPLPIKGSPSILSSLGTLRQVHSLGKSTFDWSRADAAPQRRLHGNHCQGDRALLCSSVSNFTEARMVPKLPGLCFVCPKSPCSLCFLCLPLQCKTHGKQDNR